MRARGDGGDAVAADGDEARHARREVGARDRGRARCAAAAEPLASVYKAFAQAVLTSARRCKTGRFGEDRLFINHAWRQYTRDQRLKMSLDVFKQNLVKANAERYLSLVAADMAALLDQADVKESEIRHLTARFHLLCI